MKSTIFMLVLSLSGLRTEELATPSSLLSPRNYNHHAYDVKQYLKEVTAPKPTKKGPVLFPNDGPPSPRPPLVVTSRPLSESIARSDLNAPLNNSIAEQSQISHVTYKPDYAKFEYLYTVAPIAVPDYGDLRYIPDRIPYADVVKARSGGGADNRYTDYEEQTALPPIYKALSDYAQNRLLKTKQKPAIYDYRNNAPNYGKSYQNNEITDGNDNSEYNQGENYAFSYRVKDHKTGDDFSHSQQSSGSATAGEYRVRLPDGRMQIVSYTADENGYKADVRYDEDKQIVNNVNNQYNDYRDNNAKIDNVNNEKYNVYSNLNQNQNNPKYSDYGNANQNQVNDYNYNPVANDYDRKDYNVKPVKEDYYNPYADVSKEYYNDYSLEYPNNYETHRSKFAAYKPVPTKEFVTSTVRPSYEEIKDLFTRKPNYVNEAAIEVNGPSTPNYLGTTENVVVIAPKLHTHVRSSTPLVDTINTTPKTFIVTPASYLASTIASIRERIKASKPILSNNFINRINKYLTFT